MIKRNPVYYVTGYDGDDPKEASFYKRALVFDSNEGDFNAFLIKEFNSFLKKKKEMLQCGLVGECRPDEHLPVEIIIINASHDDLPTSYETARIFKDYCNRKGYDIKAIVVNTKEDLISKINKTGEDKVLVVSQCVDKKVYNVDMAEKFEARGIVVVPGKATAPGSLFSDKAGTYKMLSDNGNDWSRVARYKKIDAENIKVEEVVGRIFDAIDLLEKEIGDRTFFVKPHEGGGGLGGFRITKISKGYIIPDLSKVSGDISKIYPTFIDFDVSNKDKLRELLWIYRLFASDEKMTKNYLKIKLPVNGTDDEEAVLILKEYLVESSKKRKEELARMQMTREDSAKCLVNAIKIFEDKFQRRYVPLVNEHIDFGLWGLRAHYRLSKNGPFLETMYHRIFQLGFTEHGLGYLGADNISNKQTGDLEIARLGPVNEIMLASVGGKQALFNTLFKGAFALAALTELVPAKERAYVPLRLQLDLAVVSSRIGEGNADTARGLCLASQWSQFVENAEEWLEDSLCYYSWKREHF
ncbi:MAG: hypothetical protein ABH869_06430 [Candidatus Omnitrophota bacterium]